MAKYEVQLYSRTDGKEREYCFKVNSRRSIISPAIPGQNPLINLGRLLRAFYKENKSSIAFKDSPEKERDPFTQEELKIFKEYLLK